MDSQGDSLGEYTATLPVGLYHTPFFGYLILGLGSQNHTVGYPKKGVWYEPTGMFLAFGGVGRGVAFVGGQVLARWHSASPRHELREKSS